MKFSPLWMVTRDITKFFIAEEDIKKMIFRCSGAIETFEWIVMPFGLKNAGATYQRAMNAIFHDILTMW